jgi:hypothetical protein
MRQRSRPAVPDDAAVIENLLELGDGFLALPAGQIRFAANVGGIEAGDVGNKTNLPVLDRRSGLPGLGSSLCGWSAIRKLADYLDILVQGR